MSFARERSEGQDAAELTHANTVEPLSAPTRTASSLSVNAGDGVSADKERPTKKRKLHPCPHDGCLNEYKQLSGLRYHLLHVRLMISCFSFVIGLLTLEFVPV